MNTKERLVVKYRNQSGQYDQEALDALNHFLRCPHSDQICEMDFQLLECINQIEKLVGKGKEIRVYSAYRSPSYNKLLINQGHGAVPKSFHTTGQAIDFSIPECDSHKYDEPHLNSNEVESGTIAAKALFILIQVPSAIGKSSSFPTLKNISLRL